MLYDFVVLIVMVDVMAIGIWPLLALCFWCLVLGMTDDARREAGVMALCPEDVTFRAKNKVALTCILWT